MSNSWEGDSREWEGKEEVEMKRRQNQQIPKAIDQQVSTGSSRRVEPNRGKQYSCTKALGKAEVPCCPGIDLDIESGT